MSDERDERLKPQIDALKAKDPSEGEVYETELKKLMDANPIPKVSYTAIVDHIEKHFGEYKFGLWAVEVTGVAPFIGFTGMHWARFAAHSAREKMR